MGPALPTCHGTGRIDVGCLDPERLGILSDALEDTGLEGVDMYQTKYTWPRTPGGIGYLEPRMVKVGTMPHPLLAALRSPGPHYRGFWALDVVLGKG